jgi:hypothetical protein
MHGLIMQQAQLLLGVDIYDLEENVDHLEDESQLFGGCLFEAVRIRVHLIRLPIHDVNVVVQVGVEDFFRPKDVLLRHKYHLVVLKLLELLRAQRGLEETKCGR